MSNEATTLEDMLGTIMTDSGLITRCAMKLRMMARHPSTDRELLAEAMGKLHRTFAGDDEKISEGVDRLFLEFKKRAGA